MREGERSKHLQVTGGDRETGDKRCLFAVLHHRSPTRTLELNLLPNFGKPLQKSLEKEQVYGSSRGGNSKQW